MNQLQQSITDPSIIRDLIPQKAPFVMLDSLHSFSETAVTTGLTIHAHNILTTEQGFTSAGLIEHMAQSIAIHTGYDCHTKGIPAPVGYIGAIKDVRIERLPAPGEVLRTEAAIVNRFMSVTLVKVESYVGEECVASCTMKTVLAEDTP